MLPYLDFLREHRTKLHEPNTLNPLNGEVKHHSVVIGIFPNDPIVTRLVSAPLLERNNKCEIQRRYTSLGTLVALGE